MHLSGGLTLGGSHETRKPLFGVRFANLGAKNKLERLFSTEAIVQPEEYQVVELAMETTLRRRPFFRWRGADIDLNPKEYTLLAVSTEGEKT